jgi:hypothetical protein
MFVTGCAREITAMSFASEPLVPGAASTNFAFGKKLVMGTRLPVPALGVPTMLLMDMVDDGMELSN